MGPKADSGAPNTTVDVPVQPIAGSQQPADEDVITPAKKDSSPQKEADGGPPEVAAADKAAGPEENIVNEQGNGMKKKEDHLTETPGKDEIDLKQGKVSDEATQKEPEKAPIAKTSGSSSAVEEVGATAVKMGNGGSASFGNAKELEAMETVGNTREKEGVPPEDTSNSKTLKSDEEQNTEMNGPAF
ncbi:unnamed protein product [Chondrus crispus]|uniref:Uncharacterized protein n=1 Tax=Chondrus crispus TaxID=2769 RepID=R7Q583_CHOCR|nr:unnamed protein product [Chondrus crispus]CDF32988.1 unnamed protein product [Chondrus crispus]|eukprot:XP_005712791.1 unnamed protein product [Chondrus crispus]